MGSNNYYTFVIASSGYLGRQGNWRIHKVGLKNSVVQLLISEEIAINENQMSKSELHFTNACVLSWVIKDCNWIQVRLFKIIN